MKCVVSHTVYEIEMVKLIYPAVLERGTKRAFGIWFPDFPAFVAAGTTPELAIEKAQAVLARAVYELAEQAEALPQPTAFEKIAIPKNCDFVAFFAVTVEPPDPSERVNIYLSKSLIDRADKRAAELGMSRSSFFGFAVWSALHSFGDPVSTALPLRKAEKYLASRAARPKSPKGRTRKP